MKNWRQSKTYAAAVTAVLSEFVADVEAAYPDGSIEDWPDLAVTFLRAKSVLDGKGVPAKVRGQ